METKNELTLDEQNYLPIFLDLVSKNDMIFAHIEDGSKEDLVIDGILQKLSDSYNNLQHFKDSNSNLYVIDKNIDDIFENIPDKDGCKTVVEAYLVQQINVLKSLIYQI